LFIGNINARLAVIIFGGAGTSGIAWYTEINLKIVALYAFCTYSVNMIICLTIIWSCWLWCRDCK